MTALDFPSSPTNGQKHPVTPGAGQPQYQWNGSTWIAVGNVSDAVKKTGDTMTGSLIINSPGVLDAAAKGHRLGNASGAAAAGSVQVTDANIILYGSGTNWAGIGTDTGGHMWFRVGNAGYPYPALWLNAQNNYTYIQNLNVAGVVTLNNNLSVSNNVSSASVNVSTSYGAGSDMFFGMNGPGAGLLQFMSNWYFSFDRATGLLGYYLGNGHYFQFRQDGQFQASLHGLSAGGGPWTAFSDARIKTVDSDYTQGLAEVCTLQPVNYTYNGNDSEAPPSNHLDPMQAAKDKSVPSVPYPNSPHYKVAQDQTKFVGLIAQQVEAVFPEMVGQQSGHIDGVAVTDLRTMNTGPLIFALVNAVKELKARVEQLEAATS